VSVVLRVDMNENMQIVLVNGYHRFTFAIAASNSARSMAASLA